MHLKSNSRRTKNLSKAKDKTEINKTNRFKVIGRGKRQMISPSITKINIWKLYQGKSLNKFKFYSTIRRLSSTIYLLLTKWLFITIWIDFIMQLIYLNNYINRKSKNFSYLQLLKLLSFISHNLIIGYSHITAKRKHISHPPRTGLVILLA